MRSATDADMRSLTFLIVYVRHQNRQERNHEILMFFLDTPARPCPACRSRHHPGRLQEDLVPRLKQEVVAGLEEEETVH